MLLKELLDFKLLMENLQRKSYEPENSLNVQR